MSDYSDLKHNNVTLGHKHSMRTFIEANSLPNLCPIQSAACQSSTSSTNNIFVQNSACCIKKNTTNNHYLYYKYDNLLTSRILVFKYKNYQIKIKIVTIKPFNFLSNVTHITEKYWHYNNVWVLQIPFTLIMPLNDWTL